ncbi:hypothetical protein EXT68_02825 [Pectobacterium parmentieri]|uniref:Uncharacterized protein n=1 Tax=Pectobacterium parmentieri TaxID=1905730 RepID=A0A0H3I0R3_PECPM|nr:hypothetical protein [Pectobacterium parmentieri]AFI89652.1 Hypothetical protein W5S_1560 [Pectobacterium parmentieri]MBI0472076.1 hypothetical protein [Pectobacterium parmentieri]MBI0495185.1 hypothetical protein [Pectobacterium parmentieri]MBI0556237.1 hypothetical protein [Pectobacterium parmentieri]MBI0569321.1 hypothetical protein [Pectobacterium parmentieri]
MKIKISLPSLHALRWKWEILREKTGRGPLYVSLVPLVLAFYWGIVLQPQIQQRQASLDEMQQQLRVPLPLLDNSTSELTTELSVTEYQQIKILFDIFNQYHLQIESGNYRFTPAEENKSGSLTLTIPLRGEWQSLAQALRDISRALPVEMEMLHISRPQPGVNLLSISLQLRLHRRQS